MKKYLLWGLAFILGLVFLFDSYEAYQSYLLQKNFLVAIYNANVQINQILQAQSQQSQQKQVGK